MVALSIPQVLAAALFVVAMIAAGQAFARRRERLQGNADAMLRNEYDRRMQAFVEARKTHEFFLNVVRLPVAEISPHVKAELFMSAVEVAAFMRRLDSHGLDVLAPHVHASLRLPESVSVQSVRAYLLGHHRRIRMDLSYATDFQPHVYFGEMQREKAP